MRLGWLFFLILIVWLVVVDFSENKCESLQGPLLTNKIYAEKKKASQYHGTESLLMDLKMTLKFSNLINLIVK